VQGTIGGLAHYSDSDSPVAFERDGTEIVKDTGSPPDGRGPDGVYRDRADRTFAKSLYHAGNPSYWLVIDKGGGQHWYGNVTDGSVPESVVRDDLGVFQWNLVRTQDPDGNVIDYEYVPNPSGTSTSNPQLQPLLSRIRYGKNLNTNSSHFARVDFTYLPTERTRLDYLHGHTYLDRVISTIDVSILAPTTQKVRTYAFTIVRSDYSARYVLKQVQEQAPGLSAPPIRFAYTENAETPFVSSPLGAGLDANVERAVDVFQTSQTWQTAAVWTALWYWGWYKDWFNLNDQDKLFTPAAVPHAFKFQDLNGDGHADILYHPNFAAGAGHPMSSGSYLQTAPGIWQSFPSLKGIGDPDLGPLSLGMPGGAADPLGLGFRPDPGQNNAPHALLASEYTDIDRDGVADFIYLAPQPQSSSFPSPPRPGGSSTTYNPATNSICNWWFENRGGYTDPSPDPQILSIPPSVIAGFAIDKAASTLGIHDQSFSRTLGGIMPALTNLKGGLFSSLPLLQIGGSLSGLGYCYKVNTINHPINTPWLPNFPTNPYSSDGQIFLGHGRLLSDPNSNMDWVHTGLDYYPNIGHPGIVIDQPHYDLKLGRWVGRSLSVTSSVYIPLADLDHSGTPDLVAVKSLASGATNYGAGLWRFQNMLPIHEFQDTNTNTQFTDSLQYIFFNPQQPTSLLGEPDVTDCSIGNPLGPLSFSIVGPASDSKKISAAGSSMAGPWTNARKTEMVRAHLQAETIREITNLGLDPHTKNSAEAEMRAILSSSALANYLASRVAATTTLKMVAPWIRPSPDDPVARSNGLDPSTWGSTTGLGGQRLLPQADWITTFVDVNADGLPDLLMATGATCVWPGSGTTNHKPGFLVFLNRGNRFETAVNGVPYRDGPFNMVRNWSSKGQLPNQAFSDMSRFPFSSLAFTDLDGDGVIDATLTARVLSHHADQPWVFDSNACLSTSWTDTLYQTHIRCAWRGTAAGWEAAPQLAADIPTCDPASSRGNACGVMNLSVSAQTWYEDGVGFTDFTPGDLLRFVDLDNDGMVDIVNARISPSPSSDPTRVYHNQKQRPDLLRQIDNGVGAVTTISYKPWAPASASAAGRIPFIPWVVDQISADSQADKSDVTVPETSKFTFESPKYDFADRDFLGFARVIERRVVQAPDGTTGGTLLVERRYLQDEMSTSTTVPHPLKGLLVQETRRADPDDGSLETHQTKNTFDLVSGGTFVRIRLLEKRSLTCQGAACADTPGSPALVVDDVRGSFDDYDWPWSEWLTVTRTVGDGFDSLGSFTTAISRTYQHKTTNWILGLMTSEVRRDVGSNHVLSDHSFLYTDTGKIQDRTVRWSGVNTACGQTTTQFLEDFYYTSDGLLQDVYDNNNAITGEGRRPHHHIDYDDAWHAFPKQESDDISSGIQVAQFSDQYSYDYRFGTVATHTDPNGNTIRSVRDPLGRLTEERDASDALVRFIAYDLTNRPVSTTTTAYPGSGQPNIQTKEYFDGFGRSRERVGLTASGALLQAWTSYDSIGGSAESAMPDTLTSATFVPRSAMSAPIARAYRDAYGRTVRHILPDQRTVSTNYFLGRQTDIDARRTPRDMFFDPLGRVVALSEYYTPATGKINLPQTQTTTFFRDADGRVTAVQDADGNVRKFTYDERGELVSAEAPHSAQATSSAIDTYVMCFDGKGRETVSVTPEGRKVTQHRDEIGRVFSRTHDPARFSGDDADFTYDETTAGNGRGRLTSFSNSTGKWALSYDQQGNVIERDFTSTLGASIQPWSDGVFTSSATYDRLNRIIGGSLSRDPYRVATPVKVHYSYNERGLPSNLSVEESLLLKIDSYTPSGRASRISYGNGLTDTRTFEPLSDRLSTTTLAGKDGTFQSNAYGYDDDDNPTRITRFFGNSTLAASTITKTFEYDSLNRLESATFDGIGAGKKIWSYGYSPAGNVTLKDGFSYRYGGRDPQAATARVLSDGTVAEQYAYDRDGQLSSTSPGFDGGSWLCAWNGDGQLVQAQASTPTSSEVYTAPAAYLYRYSAKGDRVSKQYQCGSDCTGWADVYVGALELRGSEAQDPSGVQGYYNLDLGAFHAQLALRRGATGFLERDAQADRYYYRDQVGSTIVVTAPDGSIVNSSGGAAGRLEYAPYGEPLLADTGVGQVRQRFNGKELDETHLAYYGARYASPQLGRWTARDPSALWKPEAALSSQAANLYSFDDNNPVKLIDPDGRQIPYELVERGFELVVEDWHLVVAGVTTFGSAALASLRSATENGYNPWDDISGIRDPEEHYDMQMAKLQAEKRDSNAKPSGGEQTAKPNGPDDKNRPDKDKPAKDVTISKSRHPESAKHVQDAQKAGQPSTLTIDRQGAKTRRREALRDQPTQPGTDRDEYPPAMFKEGGSGGSVRNIPSSDNRGSGACVGAQCRDFPNGTKVNIKVTDD